MPPCATVKVTRPGLENPRGATGHGSSVDFQLDSANTNEDPKKAAPTDGSLMSLPAAQVREPKTFDASDASQVVSSVTVEYKKRPFGVLAYAALAAPAGCDLPGFPYGAPVVPPWYPGDPQGQAWVGGARQFMAVKRVADLDVVRPWTGFHPAFSPVDDCLVPPVAPWQLFPLHCEGDRGGSVLLQDFGGTTTGAQLKRLYRQLSTHHTRDPLFLTRIKRAMMDDHWHGFQVNLGWKCGPCRKMNAKDTEVCAKCKKHWSKVQELTRDQQWLQDSWQPRHRNSNGGQEQRPRSLSRKAKKEKKEREKWKQWNDWNQWNTWTSDGSQCNDKPTPFAPCVPSPSESPWPVSPSPFQTMGTSQPSSSTATPPPAVQNAVNQELVKALRAAYCDSDKVPADVQELLAKADVDDARNVIKTLHQTTSALGKAKKLQQELLENRRKHRSNWLVHLEQSSRLWQQQLEEYRVKQAEFQTALGKAAADISAARNKILALNLKELPQPLQGLAELEPEPAAQEETSQDAEEEKLRTSLQATLSACASSVGPINIESARLNDLEDTKERDRKRPATSAGNGP
eukprot:Skav228007  [mRNA]  locus=scaffold390:495033:498719:- [translate_table: standard]